MGKSYKIFAFPEYRLLFLIAYPLCAIAGCAIVQMDLFSVLHRTFHFMIASGIMASMIVIIEIIGDHFLFGGVYARFGNKMEFLKLSEKGKSLYKSAMIMDQIRRTVFVISVNLANAAIGIIGKGDLAGWLEISVLITYILITLVLCNVGIVICRFSQNPVVNIAVGYLANIMLMLFMYVFSGSEVSLVVVNVVLAAGFVVSSIGSVWFSMKKMEESYHDE